MSAPNLREPAGDRMPSGDAIRKADAAMALTDAGRCGFCGGEALDEPGYCPACEEVAE